jgi:hypothetical protein
MKLATIITTALAKFFIPAAGLTLAVTAIAAAVLVLIGMRSAETPNLGEMDEDGAKVCVIAGDCNWGDQVPDELAGTIEIEPSVTLKQFRKDIQDAIDAVTGPVFKIYDAPGGSIGDHWDLYRFYARRNTKFEVLGDCASACALVLGAVDKSNLCVGPKANFAFHQAREKDPPHAISVEGTQWMVDQLPADIQAWIEKRGGVKNMPASQHDVWILWPSEIWAMGYRRCED